MPEALSLVFSGILLGLVAGISPGPILTLVISQTIKYDKRQGIIVSCAPLITDLPIIILSLLVISRLADSNSILAAISLVGALFIFFLAYESITFKSFKSENFDTKPRSLLKGLIANFSNPQPYLFWLTVGGPIIFKAYQINSIFAILYISGFYICLIGSKIIISLLVDKSKKVIQSKVYLYINKILGMLLILFGVKFIIDGYQFLN